MQITIQDPQLIQAIRYQARGLGVGEDNIAESAIASHFGFQDIAKSATGVPVDDTDQMQLHLPALATVPRSAV
jgi:hypothetical protein